MKYLEKIFKFLIFIIFFVSRIHTYNLHFPYSKSNTKIYVHLEKFNEKYNLIHIAVSFTENTKTIRCDFSPYNKQTINYINLNSYNYLENIYPRILNIIKKEKIEDIKSVKLFWGFTNKTIDEIIMYEKIINKCYILGINDCRHYSHKLTKWTINKPTPIWKLNKLFKESLP